MNFRKMSKEKVQKIISEGQLHLNFMIKIYKKQLAKGKYFIHEHPASAVSWDEREMVKLMAHDGVILTKADQCMYGLETRADDGGTAPALKPTKQSSQTQKQRRSCYAADAIKAIRIKLLSVAGALTLPSTLSNWCAHYCEASVIPRLRRTRRLSC